MERWTVSQDGSWMPSGAQAPSQGNPGGGQQVELTCSVLRSAHTEPSLCAQPSWLHSHARAGQLGAGVTIRADGGVSGGSSVSMGGA